MTELRNQEHNYEVASLTGSDIGFEIIPREADRPATCCILKPDTGWWIIYSSDDVKCNYGLPAYFFYNLARDAIFNVYETWKMPSDKKAELEEEERKDKEKRKQDDIFWDWEMPKSPDYHKIPRNISAWMAKQTGKVLNKKMHEEWRRCINQLHPFLLEIHRKAYSLSSGKGHWEVIEKAIMSGNIYLLKDMVNYKAAMTSVLWDRDSSWEKDWMLAFAYDNSKYHSLERTLINLPNRIWYSQLSALNRVYLEEPATTRLKLMAYIALGEVYTEEEGHRSKFAHIIKKSSEEDIKKAIRLMWRYFPSTKSGDFRSIREIHRALDLIFDYGLPIGNWDILGLARRSEEYHHNVEMQRTAQRMIDEKLRKQIEEGKNINTALPPIPLPKDKSIRFLDSLKAVQDEGTFMQHCIAIYAEKAIKGECYLFHVDYKGEKASVEVLPDGYVKQSYGPADTSNKASEYGKKILGKWAAKMIDSKVTIPQESMLAEGIPW